MLYFVTSFVVFLITGLFGLLIRFEQSIPGFQLVDPKTYNYLLTGHGIGMLLWWAIATHIGGFGNFLLPLMIGAKDVAFPRLNALSWWAFFAANVLFLMTLIPGNQIMTMWTGYPPFSLNNDAGITALYVFVIHLLGVSSIATAVNFLVTYITMRAPGITFFKTNLFIHTLIAANVIQLVGVPALAGAVTMLFLDKYLGTNFFNPAKGGDPLIYQNIFWFYSHPVVYVQVLPIFGFYSEIIPTFARRPLFGYP
ncbi:MAG TPA: cytochrome C oxidase subunit I, partial [Aquifex aeolicus]|nr:cytochrome C oxidase subunit I [Aquifex aeolicus]